MNNSAVKVGEIYQEASTAFSKLAEMIVLLLPQGETQPGGKWTEEEIEMLRSCVYRFAVDLNTLSKHIKNRTVSQIRTTLKKKAFEDAGMRSEVLRQVSSTVTSSTPPPTPQVLQPPPLSVFNQPVLGKNAEVTLNMLNATQDEVDVEGLGNEVKLEFETTGEEEAT